MLAPLVVAIADDLGTSVSAIGLARSVLAGTAVAVSLAIGPMIDRIGVRPLILAGSALAVAGAGATAAAPSLALLYAAHAVTGAGVACLLTAGFAGVTAFFPASDAAWAIGYVVGLQSLAWIFGNPLVGFLADQGSWRLAYLVPGSVAALALATALVLAPRTSREGRTAEGTLVGLGAVFRDRSARRWTVAELVAYAAWTAELTYAGAFYIKSYGVSETATGVLLSIGSLAFLAVSLSTERLMQRVHRRRAIAVAALGMGALLVPILNLTPSVWFTVGLFCLMAACASVRTTGSSALGLAQLPDRPGAMMGARTASAQLGYVVGAGAGGAVLALAGFGALGFVLCAGMAVSALLISRVTDPL